MDMENPPLAAPARLVLPDRGGTRPSGSLSGPRPPRTAPNPALLRPRSAGGFGSRRGRFWDATPVGPGDLPESRAGHSQGAIRSAGSARERGAVVPTGFVADRLRSGAAPRRLLAACFPDGRRLADAAGKGFPAGWDASPPWSGKGSGEAQVP